MSEPRMELEALLKVARTERLTPSAKARIRQAVVTTPPPVASRLPVVVGGAAVAALGFLVAWALFARSATSTPAPSPSGPAAADAPVARPPPPAPGPLAPLTAAPSAPVTPSVPTSPAPPSAPHRRPATSARTPAASAPAPAATPSLREELVLLERARIALAGTSPAAALEPLEEHARRFPQGALREEREAARVRALCASGRQDEGRRAAAAFAREFAASPHASRIYDWCGR